MAKLIKAVIVSFIYLLLLKSQIGLAASLKFYGEESPPLFYKNEEGVPTGAIYDITQALIERIEIDSEIAFLPWARALFEAENHSNIVLVALAKSPQREDRFQWVGKVHDVEDVLLKLKQRDDINIQTLEQAKAYNLATIRGYATATFLKRSGFVEGENLSLVSSSDQMWSMLFKQRIDLVMSNKTTAPYEIKSAGFDIGGVEPALQFTQIRLEIAMATGLQTNAETLALLREGLQSLKDDGTYQAIMKKWGLE